MRQLRPTSLAVAAIAVAGLVLRATGIDQSLFGDELFTHGVVTRAGLGDVLDGVRDTESTPPLFYVLAWLSGKLGDDTVTIRIPSLVAGAVTVPATYALGVRALGDRAAAVAGAAVGAVSPAAIYYSTEARAYGLAACLVAIALWALLVALDDERRRWWAACGAASAAALYTHYVALFPLAGAFAWALAARRERSRQVLLTAAAVAVAYAPWLPFVKSNPLLEEGARSAPLTLESFARYSARAFPGHPYVTLPELPGGPALVVLAAAALCGLAAVRRLRPPPGVALLAAVTAATPAGLLVYSALGSDIYQPRFLMVSVPAAALLLGALLTAPRGRLRIATAVAGVAAVAVGGANTAFDPDDRRPPYDEAAKYVESRLAPGETIGEVQLFLSRTALARQLSVYLNGSGRRYAALPVRQPDGRYVPILPAEAWEPVRAGGRVYVVVPHTPSGFLPPPPPASARARLLERRLFRGFVPVAVYTYGRAPA